MKKYIYGKLYDTESCLILAASEDPECCSFPKGSRFQTVKLCKSEEGDIFLWGQGMWGCHTIVPLSEAQEGHWWTIFKCLV